MSDSNIPAEAVEAAAKAAYASRPATYYLDDSVVTWDQLSESGSGQNRKDRQLAEARAALEAAAPGFETLTLTKKRKNPARIGARREHT